MLTGTFSTADLDEVSGVAASALNPGVLWLLDDGPGTTGVWAVRSDGERLGFLAVVGMDGSDTEDLAIAPCGGSSSSEAVGHVRPCLWIGDIGDNRRRREHVAVLRLAEPDLRGGVPTDPVPAEVMALRYPGGATDAEALLVAPDGGSLVVVAKAAFDDQTGVTGATTAYAATGFADQELTALGEVFVPPAEIGVAAAFVGASVTGGAATTGRVLLRTYDHVVEYVAPEPAAPLATFPSWPAQEVPGPGLPQAEAVAWDNDSCGYWLVSEQIGELWQVACR